MTVTLSGIHGEKKGSGRKKENELLRWGRQGKAVDCLVVKETKAKDAFLFAIANVIRNFEVQRTFLGVMLESSRAIRIILSFFK